VKTVLVKWDGRKGVCYVSLNGKRWAFNDSMQPQEIPVEVLRILWIGGGDGLNVVPVSFEGVKVQIEEKDAEIAELKRQIGEMLANSKVVAEEEQPEKRKPGRPKKVE